MSKIAKHVPNKVGRTKSSFSQTDIDSCEDQHLREEMNEHVVRVENFLKEVELHGGISAIAKYPHTRDLLRAKKTGLNNFQKSLKHMTEGKGLLSDPLMLRAVMKDMNYSLDMLYGLKTNSIPSVELTMSAGSVEVIQKAVYNALHPEETVIKQAGFPKKLLGAHAILAFTDQFTNNPNAYRNALEILFIGFSCHEHRLFPHLRNSTMDTIDALCREYFNGKGIQDDYERYGRLLLLSYILYMISCLVTALIRYTRRYKSNNAALYQGFINLEPEEVSKLETSIRAVNKTLFEIVTDFCVSKTLYNTEQIDNSIKNAREILSKLVKFELLSEKKGSNDIITGDFIIAVLSGMRIKEKPYLGSIQDSVFIEDVSNLLVSVEEIQKRPPENPSKNTETQIFVHRSSYRIKGELPGDGRSWTSPFETLDEAIESASNIPTNGKPVMIFISNGYFEVKEKTIKLPSNVHLQGGWVHEGSQWVCKDRNETVIFSRTERTLFDCNSTQNLTIENLTLVFPGKIPSFLGIYLSYSLYKSIESPMGKALSLKNLDEMTIPINAAWAKSFAIQKCHVFALEVPSDSLLFFNNSFGNQLSDITFETMSQDDFSKILQSANRRRLTIVRK